MVQIRIASLDDAAAIREIYAPFIEQSSITFHTEVPSVQQVRGEIQDVLSFYPWLVAVADSGQIVGYAYASQHHPRQAYRWSVNVSIYLTAGNQGKGIGRGLYAELLPILRRQGFRMVHAGITLPNEPSRKIHESFGFQHVGTFPQAGFKLGRWKDVGWWVLDLMTEAHETQSVSEPVPFPDLP